MSPVPAKTETTDVAIVEDNAALGSSLKKVVESDATLRCIGVWTTAEDALKKIDAFRPHIVLMDINLPGMSGIEATARLKQYLPDIKVVMVTVYRDHDKIFAALKAAKPSTTSAAAARR
jgi:DNA-binding NarL/FixJ family response regulator